MARTMTSRVAKSRNCPIGLFLVLLLLTGTVSHAETETHPDEFGVGVLLRSPDVPLGQDGLAVPAAGATFEEDGQWLMPLKDYAGTRYSGLDEINTDNVHELELHWSFGTDIVRGHEATPLVVGDTMFIVMPFPFHLYAFDLRLDPPEVKWIYDPQVNPASQGVACCDHVNRGAAYADGRLFYAALDTQAVAVDAETGEELWKVTLGDIQMGETMTMAPLVIGSNVIFGNAGGEFGVRGWILALDAETGEEVWRAYSTGPDNEVLIGESFEPFYEDHLGENLGIETWPGDLWRIGGANVWGYVTYDPENDLLYYGTGNAAPWNPDVRPGDNKWAGTVFARRPATGEAIWAYQWDPAGLYDWDGVNESVLLDMPIDGQLRQVLVRAERNGWMYTIDRLTGEVLNASTYMPANAHLDIDLITGQPEINPDKVPGFGRTARNICPAVPGAKDWEPMAFSPRTGLLYVPANNMCIDIEGTEANFIAGTPYMGVTSRMFAGEGGHLGEIIAWDPVRNERVWMIKERFLTWSGPLATAGDLVFYGTMDRYFRAADARTGEVLWEYRTDTGIIAPPISYLGPDGHQYIAVLSGPGGWAGSVVSVPLDPRDSTADKGIVHAMRELPQYTDRGGYLYVFRLP